MMLKSMRLADIIERVSEDREAKKTDDCALGPFHFIHLENQLIRLRKSDL